MDKLEFEGMTRSDDKDDNSDFYIERTRRWAALSPSDWIERISATLGSLVRIIGCTTQIVFAHA